MNCVNDKKMENEFAFQLIKSGVFLNTKKNNDFISRCTTKCKQIAQYDNIMPWKIDVIIKRYVWNY